MTRFFFLSFKSYLSIGVYLNLFLLHIRRTFKFVLSNYKQKERVNKKDETLAHCMCFGPFGKRDKDKTEPDIDLLNPRAIQLIRIIDKTLS